MINKDQSPFTPGVPVPLDYFTGRVEQLQRIERAWRQCSAGRPSSLFITGERGIGKSSLADFAQYLAQKEHGFVGAHCYLGAARSVDEVTRLVFPKLLQEMPDSSLFEKARDVLGRYVRGVDLFGVSVEFTREPRELEDLRLRFVSTLHTIYQAISPERKGIVLILDDLNGISRQPEFALFLKSMVDDLASSARASLPLALVLVGVEERMRDLVQSQPSVARIFDIIQLNPMTEEESRQFFSKAFDSVRVAVQPAALNPLIYFSGGLPMLMHEVGDAVFWTNTDEQIDEDDAYKGIFVAAENIGRKYLDPQVYDSIRSRVYLSILRRIGKLPLGKQVRRSEILAQIPEDEKKKFDNFLRKMETLGVFKRGEEKGVYIFVNELYRLYVQLEALRVERLQR